MRLPSTPEALENTSETPNTVSRDPSYPDRARIDSDVRAFLRPASSPWIVFDRDSRVDDFAKTALRVGAVFASSPGFVEPGVADDAVDTANPTPILLEPLPNAQIAEPARAARMTEPLIRDAFAEGGVLTSPMSSALPSEGAFPASTTAHPESVQEPSSLVVASDVMPTPEETREPLVSDPFAVPGLVPNRRAGWIAGACAGLLVVAGVMGLVLASGKPHVKSAAAATKVEMAPPVAAEAAPPAVVGNSAPQAQEPAVATPEPAPTPSPAASAPTESGVDGKASNDPKRRFGKFTIKAEAKGKTVWFDGKRMLGTGQRSFLVFCGMHTVAVADKAASMDVEIPCNGEYAVK